MFSLLKQTNLQILVKTNKTGFVLGTSFEYYDDFILGIEGGRFMKKLKRLLSARQQEQKGDYFDNFINLTFDYDKRNQKFQTTMAIEVLLALVYHW